MNSIRKKLNFSIMITMIVLLSATSLLLYTLISRQVEEVFDSAVLDKAQALIALTEFDEEGLAFDFSEENLMPEFNVGEVPQYYQLWQNGDEDLIKSPSLGDNELKQIGSSLGQHKFADLALHDGRAGRMIEITFMPRIEVEVEGDKEYVDPSNYPPSYPITMIFARERASLDDSLLAIGFSIFGVILLVLIITGLLVRGLIGSGLSPLSSLARQVSEIDESRLDLRLSHKGEQSIEIAPIENQINHLIERLQSAFEREKRFSSNVAHELRTPLSELRTLAEVATMVPDDKAQIEAFFADVGGISSQMEKIVTTLLELARSDAGLLSIDPEEIDLAAYCDEIWQHAINGQAQGKRLINDIQPSLVINTDRAKLGLILSNLFTNAVSYSPHNAEVQIDSNVENNYVVLSVKNLAINLQPEDILHMKDRFWRKQKATDEMGHSGLGLSLVEALARILKLNVSLKLDQKDVFMVTISGLSPVPNH